jgi:hypothetical protein
VNAYDRAELVYLLWAAPMLFTLLAVLVTL